MRSRDNFYFSADSTEIKALFKIKLKTAINAVFSFMLKRFMKQLLKNPVFPLFHTDSTNNKSKRIKNGKKICKKIVMNLLSN